MVVVRLVNSTDYWVQSLISESDSGGLVLWKCIFIKLDKWMSWPLNFQNHYSKRWFSAEIKFTLWVASRSYSYYTLRWNYIKVTFCLTAKFFYLCSGKWSHTSWKLRKWFMLANTVSKTVYVLGNIVSWLKLWTLESEGLGQNPDSSTELAAESWANYPPLCVLTFLICKVEIIPTFQL